MAESHRPSVEQVAVFLTSRFDDDVTNIEPLRGGFWSSAYRFDVGRDALVLRLSESSEGFEMDRAAHRFNRPALPVPEVLDVGRALGRCFAISRRSTGSFLEDLSVVDAGGAHEARRGQMVDGLLEGLRSVDGGPQEAPVDWFSSTPGSWRSWLSDRLVDDPAATVSGWRTVLAEDPELNGLFNRTVRRIEELIPQCPERRDLVHGDLLHQNVLISDDAGAVNAVFSWKCSTLGDHLYDVAWLTFWEPWHPGIAQLDMWRRTVGDPARVSIEGDDLVDAALRHHCYELNIGAQHLAWCAWTANAAALAGVAIRTAAVLDRGPRRS